MSSSLGSVLDPGDAAQFLGRARAESEEFEIGRDLFEQHVGADLDGASLLHRGAKQRRELLLHDDLAHERRWLDPGDVKRQRVISLHSQRTGVDYDIVAGRIIRAGYDLQ